jgi:hypothetical protein
VSCGCFGLGLRSLEPGLAPEMRYLANRSLLVPQGLCQCSLQTSQQVSPYVVWLHTALVWLVVWLESFGCLLIPVCGCRWGRFLLLGTSTA